MSGTPTVRQLIREDFNTHGRSRLSPGLHALVVHRLGTALHGSSHPLLRWLRPFYRFARALVTAVYSVELPVGAHIGRRLHLPHAHGIVFVVGSTIGDDCMVRHNVTLGAGSSTGGGCPTVGDRVQFGPGSIVTGEISVGDDVLIGPGAVVVKDVPSGSRVLAPIATVRAPSSRDVETPRRLAPGKGSS